MECYWYRKASSCWNHLQTEKYGTQKRAHGGHIYVIDGRRVLSFGAGSQMTHASFTSYDLLKRINNLGVC